VIIPERVRAIRIERNISLEEVERRAGLPPSYLTDLENEQLIPPLDVLEEIARALDVPLPELFYDAKTTPDLRNLQSRQTADEIAGGDDLEESKKSRT
jgi:transcriptional regulator with XRE-family HTH domain